MKIEFLESGSNDCPLIRIYGDEPDVCKQFLRVFTQLSNGSSKKVSLTELPGVEPLARCSLTARVFKRDRGIVLKQRNVFDWMLTADTWDNVAVLIEPFCLTEANGFQWLDQVPASAARVIISTSPVGHW
jgi:hypothetical protein